MGWGKEKKKVFLIRWLQEGDLPATNWWDDASEVNEMGKTRTDGMARRGGSKDQTADVQVSQENREITFQSPSGLM